METIHVFNILINICVNYAIELAILCSSAKDGSLVMSPCNYIHIALQN